MMNGKPWCNYARRMERPTKKIRIDQWLNLATNVLAICLNQHWRCTPRHAKHLQLVNSITEDKQLTKWKMGIWNLILICWIDLVRWMDGCYEFYANAWRLLNIWTLKIFWEQNLKFGTEMIYVFALARLGLKLNALRFVNRIGKRL